MVQSNYRLWGDDFIGMTPRPGVTLGTGLPNNCRVLWAAPLTCIVIKKWTMVLNSHKEMCALLADRLNPIPAPQQLVVLTVH